MTDETEFFYDERNETLNGDWSLKTDGGFGGGGWGGDSSGGEPSGGGWGDSGPKIAPWGLNLTQSGALFCDADGMLVTCRQRCKVIPAMLIYIAGENASAHRRCVLCRTSDPDRELELQAAAAYDGTSATPALTAGWPIGAPGSYRVRAKWQGGHYDHSKIFAMRFVIYGVSTGWMTIPLTRWRDIATVAVDDLHRLVVNGVPAKRAGNLTYLE